MKVSPTSSWALQTKEHKMPTEKMHTNVLGSSICNSPDRAGPTHTSISAGCVSKALCCLEVETTKTAGEGEGVCVIPALCSSPTIKAIHSRQKGTQRLSVAGAETGWGETRGKSITFLDKAGSLLYRDFSAGMQVYAHLTKPSSWAWWWEGKARGPKA